MNAITPILLDWRTTDHAYKLKRVKEMTLDGMSARQIALTFTNCSRSAVIGLWHRYLPGISRAADPSRKRVYSAEPQIPPKPRSPRASPQVVIPVSPVHEATPLASLLSRRMFAREINAGEVMQAQCAWVMDGRADDGSANVCGADVHARSYCKHHYDRGYIRRRRLVAA